jgi:hypothetical protein
LQFEGYAIDLNVLENQTRHREHIRFVVHDQDAPFLLKHGAE